MKHHPEFDEAIAPLAQPILRYLGILCALAFTILAIFEDDTDAAARHFLIVMLAILAISLTWRGVDWRRLLWPRYGRSRCAIASIFLAILVFTSLLLLVSMLILFLGEVWSEFKFVLEDRYSLEYIGKNFNNSTNNFLNLLKLIILMVFISPFVEELLFRYIIFGRLLFYTNRNIAILLNISLFSFFHNFGINSVIVGLFAIYLFIRTGSIFSSIVYHSSINLIIILLSLTMVKLYYGVFIIDYEKLAAPNPFLISEFYPIILTVCSFIIVGSILFCRQVDYRPFGSRLL